MPEAAKPKPPAPAPHGYVQSAGKQEDFSSAAVELAESLGWKGEPDWVANDIAVSDAVGFLRKSLHEFFVAGAKGSDLLPAAGLAVCEHLGLSSDAEKSSVVSALGGAFEAGNGSAVSHHAIVARDIGAATFIKISDAEKTAETVG